MPDFNASAKEELPLPRERLESNLASVRKRIEAACERAGRDAAEVTLMAVTKNRPSSAVDALFDLGVADIGENRVQEAEAKAAHAARPVRWHMIGNLQKNKAGKAVPLFHSLHSLDSLSLLDALQRRIDGGARPPVPLPFPVFVQVNVSGEASKSGLPPEKLRDFLREARTREAFRIAGLMSMPPWSESPESSRPFHRSLASLAREAADAGALPSPPGLSMGMSDDFEVAVEEGATVVRVGSALFA